MADSPSLTAGSNNDPKFTAKNSLLSGAAAGFFVDITLFPLDTIKTRLQSANGFWKSGGFRNIYSGLASTAVGSAPNAALFFLTYDTVKHLCLRQNKPEWPVHIFAASCGEVTACLVRVPVEVVKQRAQANVYSSSWKALRVTISSEGFAGLYRGYFSTLLREIPFSLIEFPVWELFKQMWCSMQGRKVEPWQSALCGSVAGGIAAALTTPLDVAKTRIMLANKGTLEAQGHTFQVLQNVWKLEGSKGLFAGLIPRVTWISIGGFVFFGVYEKAMKVLQNL